VTRGSKKTFKDLLRLTFGYYSEWKSQKDMAFFT